MSGLTNDRTYLSVVQRAILGMDSWQNAVMDYFEGAGDATLRTLFQHSGFIGAGATLVVTGAGGSRVFAVSAGTHRVYANGRLLVFTSATLGCSGVPYKEGALQYIGIQGDTYPVAVDAATDGTNFMKHTGVGVGKTYTPSAVTVVGDGLRIVLPLDAWTKAAATRPIVAWKSVLATGSSEAFYVGVAEVDGASVVVNVPHAFGQGVASTTAADYAVFVAGPVVQATAIDEDLAAECSELTGISGGGFSGTIIRSLDGIETSLRAIESGPVYVGGFNAHYGTIFAALAAGHKYIVVTGPTLETATLNVPRGTTIEAVRSAGDLAVSWAFDDSLFLIEDPIGVIIRGISANPTHTAALPDSQTRVVVKIVKSPGGVENLRIENLLVTKGSHANSVPSGIIQATGIDYAENVVIRDIDGWFGDFGIDLGGASKFSVDNVRLRRSGDVAQSAGPLKHGFRLNGGVAAGVEDGRSCCRDIRVYGPKSTETAPDFAGPGIILGDVAATVGARLFGVQAFDVTSYAGLDLAANCDDCVVVGGEVTTRGASVGVNISGVRCKAEDVNSRATITGSCSAILVNGKRTTLHNCDAKSTATATGTGIAIAGTPASDYSIVTNCQTNGSTLANSNAGNTTVANNRDDA